MNNMAHPTPIGLRPLPPNGKNRHLWEEIGKICEGVKQICCCWVNKNIFFTSCGGENDLHTFTNVFSGGALVCGATEKREKMPFFAQKTAFVNNCEIYIYAVVLLLENLFLNWGVL